MIRNKLWLGLFFIFISSVVLAKSFTNSPYSPIDISVKMEKRVFKVGEKVEGRIYLENNYPTSLPAVFVVKLYHEEKYINQVVVSMNKIPPARLVYTFKKFGIPIFNHKPDTVGKWRITIGQMSAEGSEIKEIELKIVP